MESLPIELWLLVLPDLPTKDVWKLQMVSRKVRAALLSPEVLKYAVKRGKYDTAPGTVQEQARLMVNHWCLRGEESKIDLELQGKVQIELYNDRAAILAGNELYVVDLVKKTKMLYNVEENGEIVLSDQMVGVVRLPEWTFWNLQDTKKYSTTLHYADLIFTTPKKLSLPGKVQSVRFKGNDVIVLTILDGLKLWKHNVNTQQEQWSDVVVDSTEYWSGCYDDGLIVMSGTQTDWNLNVKGKDYGQVGKFFGMNCRSTGSGYDIGSAVTDDVIEEKWHRDDLMRVVGDEQKRWWRGQEFTCGEKVWSGCFWRGGGEKLAVNDRWLVLVGEGLKIVDFEKTSGVNRMNEEEMEEIEQEWMMKKGLIGW